MEEIFDEVKEEDLLLAIKEDPEDFLFYIDEIYEDLGEIVKEEIENV